MEIVKNIIPEYKSEKERELKLQNIYNGIQKNLSRKRENKANNKNKK